MEEKSIDISRFLDTEGKVIRFPSKHAAKQAVVAYIAEKFEVGRDYTEREVNELLERWHTFGDLFLLRRSLVDYKLLARTPNGSRYWVIKTE